MTQLDEHVQEPVSKEIQELREFNQLVINLIDELLKINKDC